MTKKKRQNQSAQNRKTRVAAPPPKPIATTQTSPIFATQPGNRYPLFVAIVLGFCGPLLLGYLIKLNSIWLTYFGYVSAGIAVVCAFFPNLGRANPKWFKWTEGTLMVFGFVSLAVAYHVAQSESNQVNGEIKGAYEKTIEDNKAHYESTITEIKQSNEDIRKAVFVLASGQDLWDAFPFGYIVFCGKGKDPQVAPVFNRGYEFPVADWKGTEIVLDSPKKTFSYTLVSISWKKPDGTPGHMTGTGRIGTHSGTYTLGKPVQGGLIHMTGQINPHFEVIDDNPEHQICVIGFTKDE